MNKVIAALDNDAAARPVALTALSVAALFGAKPEAVHVREDGAATAAASAGAAGIEMRLIGGSPLAGLKGAAEPDDVSVVVLGARATPAGRHPAGSTALELITSLRKPVVVVPPNAAHPERIESVLVPLDGTRASASALAGIIELARGSEIEVIVLHVIEEASLPSFSDQPQHEERAWAEEFVARYCPCPLEEVKLELRVGRPHEHVVRIVRETGADLLALGWSQNLAPGRAAVVRESLAQSPVPVLLVPVIDSSERGGASR